MANGEPFIWGLADVLAFYQSEVGGCRRLSGGSS